MSDKEEKFFSRENPDEGAAAIDQPEVEGHRFYLASEDPDERVTTYATDQPEVEGHRFHATEDGQDERWVAATDQPEVEGHKWTPATENPDQPEVEGHKWTPATEDPDERNHSRSH